MIEPLEHLFKAEYFFKIRIMSTNTIKKFSSITWKRLK